MPARPSSPPDASAEDLEPRVRALGEDLRGALGELLDLVPGRPQGPQALARALGLDKVLASRLLKALRQVDPRAVVHHLPGPEPLRRVLRAARRTGVPAAVADRASGAVEDFEQLIRRDVGDRSALGAILSAWIPEARAEFELRRKQSAHKALSELRGVACDHDLAIVLLAPAASGERIDVVWVQGLFGLRRLRPGALVRFATRRLGSEAAGRRPEALGGGEPGSERGLEAFCANPPVRAEARRFGEVVHYVLAGEDFGRDSAVDHLTVEVSREEMARFVPAGARRSTYVFAEVSVPARVLTFEVWVHAELLVGAEPTLTLHDTASGGVVDVNDPSRELDRLDVHETLELLGRGLAGGGATPFPRQRELLQHVHRELGWDPDDFRGYRCSIDYPLLGSQVTLAFPAASRP